MLGFAKARESAAAGLHLTAQQLMQALTTSPAFLAGTFLAGLIGSLLAGYVAALIAGRNEILVGLLSAILSVGGNLIVLAGGKSTIPFPLLIVSLLIAPLLGVLGGQIRMSTAGRR